MIEASLRREYTNESLRQYESFVHSIGAIPDSTSLVETLVDLESNQIQAFYEPSTRTFYTVERQADSGDLDPMVVVHELTHALDDQVVGLDSLMASASNDDEVFAAKALVEGSATEDMIRFALQAGYAESPKREVRPVIRSGWSQRRNFEDQPRYFQNQLATYTCGMFFILGGNLEDLVDDSDERMDVEANFIRAAKHCPRSSEQILHPRKYWVEGSRDEPVDVDDARIGKLLEPLGFHILSAATGGEILAASLTAPPGQKIAPIDMWFPWNWTNAAAEGWGGDRFYVLGPASGSAHPALWITLWDTPGDRDQFEFAYRSRMQHPTRVIRLGLRGAVFLYDIPEDSASRMDGILHQGEHLGLTKAGRPWDPRTSN